MSTDSTKKLDDIIQQYSDKSDYIKEKLNDPNSSDIQDNLKKLVERVEQCKTLKDDFSVEIDPKVVDMQVQRFLME